MARLTNCRDKVTVVTGASSGIGRLLTLRLAREGALLALVARSRDALEKLADEVRGIGARVLVTPCDVGSRDEVFAAAEAVRQQLGPVDLLINNAGYGHHRSFLEWDIDDIERMMRVNYLGSVYWTKALLPAMVERKQGWIVFVASVAGKIGVPDESAYVASKFAMVGLAESLSYEVHDAGVHVLTVCPGAVDTPFFDEEALRRMPAVAKRTMIRPEQVVEAVMNGLRQGRYEVTVPSFIQAGYVVRAIAPGLMRRNTRRATTLGSTS